MTIFAEMDSPSYVNTTIRTIRQYPRETVSPWTAWAHALADEIERLRKIVERHCAACAGDPEAHGLHVCGKEPLE